MHCWACWDSADQSTFIRPCLGCLDPELQYIHQDCMNRYMNSLPSINVVELSTSDELGFWESLWYRPTAESLPLLELKCTRCLDNYDIDISYKSRVYNLLYNFRPILIALIGLFLCSAVVITSSIYLLMTGNHQMLNSPLFAFFGFPGISIKIWSILLCIGYFTVNIIMWCFVVFKIPPFRVITVHSKVAL